MSNILDLRAKRDGERAVLVLTTWPADRDASALAEALVDEGVAACVNILPEMESVYRWKGTRQRDPERQVLIKTVADRVEAVHARLRSLHPYELPEFLVVDVAGGSAAYLDWIRQSAGGRSE